jgi:hypothetical protein
VPLVNPDVPPVPQQVPVVNPQVPPVPQQVPLVNLPPEPSAPQSQPTPRPRNFNPSATEFHPENRDQPSTSTDFMRSYVDFMARRELIANKIEKFDDNPMNYDTWKASFKNMINNVTITPIEQFSLLIEYTTLTSKQLVQRLRNAYIERQHQGILEIWKKLDERYGCNAVLVKTDLAKLTSFPKIN